MRDSRRTLLVAAILIALATLLGAFGAHALRAELSPEHLQVYEIAVRYQFLHSLGLLAIGVLRRTADSRMLRCAANLLLVGIFLFSGSLYLLACGAAQVLGIITPVGGLALIGGWAVLAAAVWRG